MISGEEDIAQHSMSNGRIRVSVCEDGTVEGDATRMDPLRPDLYSKAVFKIA